MIDHKRLREIKKQLDVTPAELLEISTELLSFRNKYGVSKRRKAEFTPPTPQEVEQYAESIDFKLDGEYFVDYYNARKWEFKAGQKMKCWKSTIRTWKKNHERRSGNTVMDRTWGEKSLTEVLK